MPGERQASRHSPQKEIQSNRSKDPFSGNGLSVLQSHSLKIFTSTEIKIYAVLNPIQGLVITADLFEQAFVADLVPFREVTFYLSLFYSYDVSEGKESK